MDGLSVNDYRVAVLSKSYLTVKYKLDTDLMEKYALRKFRLRTHF